MNRPDFRDREQASLVRQSYSPEPKLARNQPGRPHPKKLFIVKELTAFPNTTVTAARIQCILIFDDHPKSLRMVSMRHLSADLARASLRPKHHDVIFALFLMLLLAA